VGWIVGEGGKNGGIAAHKMGGRDKRLKKTIRRETHFLCGYDGLGLFFSPAFTISQSMCENGLKSLKKFSSVRQSIIKWPSIQFSNAVFRKLFPQGIPLENEGGI
jgi:hypothetical protein